jgi:hypothetical protein
MQVSSENPKMKKYIVQVINIIVAAMPVVFMLLVYDGRLTTDSIVVPGYFILLAVSLLSVWSEGDGRKKKDD